MMKKNNTGDVEPTRAEDLCKFPGEREYLRALREAASQGVGYGWMQQVCEWEWRDYLQGKAGAWGPYYYENLVTRLETEILHLKAKQEYCPIHNAAPAERCTEDLEACSSRIDLVSENLERSERDARVDRLVTYGVERPDARDMSDAVQKAMLAVLDKRAGMAKAVP